MTRSKIEKIRFSRTTTAPAFVVAMTTLGVASTVHAQEQPDEMRHPQQVAEKEALGEARFAPSLGFWVPGDQPEPAAAHAWRTPAIPEAGEARVEAAEPKIELAGGAFEIFAEMGVESRSWDRVAFLVAAPTWLERTEATSFAARAGMGTRFGTIGKLVQPWAQGTVSASTGGTIAKIHVGSNSHDVSVGAIDLGVRGGIDVFPWPFLGGGPLVGYRYGIVMLSGGAVDEGDLSETTPSDEGHTLGVHIRYQSITSAGSVPGFFVDLFAESQKGDFVSATYGRANIGLGFDGSGEVGIGLETCLDADSRQLDTFDLNSAFAALATSFPLDSRYTVHIKAVF